jgi:hypothetical protein
MVSLLCGRHRALVPVPRGGLMVGTARHTTIRRQPRIANQESDFDPDPAARADGIAQHHRFLRTLGFVNVTRQR